MQKEASLAAAPVQELLEAEKENQQDIVDVIDEERSKIKATTQITEVVWSCLALLIFCYSPAPRPLFASPSSKPAFVLLWLQSSK